MTTATITIPCCNIAAIPPENYQQMAVWATRRSAEEWAKQHGWPAGSVCRIKVGSRNMSFTQWVLRDEAGFVLSEQGYVLLTQQATA